LIALEKMGGGKGGRDGGRFWGGGGGASAARMKKLAQSKAHYKKGRQERGW